MCDECEFYWQNHVDRCVAYSGQIEATCDTEHSALIGVVDRALFDLAPPSEPDELDRCDHRAANYEGLISLISLSSCYCGPAGPERGQLLSVTRILIDAVLDDDFDSIDPITYVKQMARIRAAAKPGVSVHSAHRLSEQRIAR
ncbi:MAG: hypothetical protein AB8G99_15475 [Planctomycetaceae bacterium]